MTAQPQDLASDAAAADRARWLDLAEARTTDQLCSAWLNVLAQSLADARAGLMLLAQADGSFAPAATLPPGRDLRYLADIATDALRQREGLVRRDELGHARVAYPLQSAERPGAARRLDGAVVLDLGPADDAVLERALRLTQWGAGWLLDHLDQSDLEAQRQRSARGGELLDLLLALLAEPGLREAAWMLVNRLGREFDCRQIQLGLVRRQSVRVAAMSHAASFDDRAEAVHLAEQAMHEAFDQRQRIDWPPPDEADGRIVVAHRRYAEVQRSGALTSLPLVTGTQVVGVLLLERSRPFERSELEVLDTVALALAPIIELRRDAELGAIALTSRRAARWFGVATGRSFPAIKLALAAALAALAALAFVPAPYRVAAPALVEGAVQRSAVAPFDGFLHEAPARAGDVVRAGQVLARLDDRDLQLERVRWASELEVAQRREREAMAKENRVEQRLAAAQANQARAQLELVLARLERVQVSAPFDAVVVKGDLSQLLGAPLEQGKVLFELAPLDAWRVILKVDERDIGQVALGASGELVLAAVPGVAWPFTVKRLTPVAVAVDGQNFFRVEAELGDRAPALRPNMEGVAKVAAGERSLLWIWTHRLVDWARLAWWRLQP